MSFGDSMVMIMKNLKVLAQVNEVRGDQTNFCFHFFTVQLNDYLAKRKYKCIQHDF